MVDTKCQAVGSGFCMGLHCLKEQYVHTRIDSALISILGSYTRISELMNSKAPLYKKFCECNCQLTLGLFQVYSW